MIQLGEKIKAIRLDKGISQFEIETELGLGYGSISRIESNHTIPTYRSIVRIAEYLKLEDREFDYLLGSRAKTPDEKEIEEIIRKTQNMWENESDLILLRDDHFRICAASKALKKVLNIDSEMWKRIYLKNIISVVLDPSLPMNFLPKEGISTKIEELRPIISAFYFETRSMHTEPDVEEVVTEVTANPVTNAIWKDLINDESRPLYLLLKEKKLTMKLGNQIINLNYYTEHLPNTPKYAYIEFVRINFQ